MSPASPKKYELAVLRMRVLLPTTAQKARKVLHSDIVEATAQRLLTASHTVMWTATSLTLAFRAADTA